MRIFGRLKDIDDFRVAKVKTIYVCQNCGASASKWIGKCPACGEWNTYAEEKSAKEPASGFREKNIYDGELTPDDRLSPVGQISTGAEIRTVLADQELNRVLGGGLVPGSLILLGGEPGIGKSTLLLQMVLKAKEACLYVSGEESLRQIKMRADRIGIDNQDCYLLAETDVDEVVKEMNRIKPSMVVIDSIQTLYSKYIDSTPGSISQIRECAALLMRFAKQSNVPVWIIGHITKEGSIAGPKILEHMVDTVLQFEGDRHHNYRIVRSLKNRFGSASELGIYEMQGSGLREVSNPSEILITRREEPLSGITISSALEGMRPLFVETQALVSSAVYGNPQRNANAFDLRRLNMLLAVLEKRCGYYLHSNDVFVNIAGGLRLDDPAIDLGLAVAIVSSLENQPVPPAFCFAGELGLSGEIRPVQKLTQRIAEAAKLGFNDIVVSSNAQETAEPKGIKVHKLARIDEVLSLVFG